MSMGTIMSTTKLESVAKWDGKQETYSVYNEQARASCEYQGLGDALDVTMMGNLVTKAEYDLLDKSDTTNADLIKLYNVNKKVMAMLTLGNSSTAALATIKKTKTKDHPYGVATEVFASWDRKFMPGDSAAELQQDNDIANIRFTAANVYYDEVINAVSQYSVPTSDTQLIKHLAKRINNSMFTKMILDELSKADVDHDFEELCSAIAKIQRLQKTDNSTIGKSEKEVQLTSQDRDPKYFPGKCGTCNKTGHKRVDCPNKGKGSGNGNKKCNHCGRQGHLEDQCWKKHPEKAPQWMKDKVSKSAQGASVDKEIQLCSLCNAEESDFV